MDAHPELAGREPPPESGAGEQHRQQRPSVLGEPPLGRCAHGDHSGNFGVGDAVAENGNSAHRGPHRDDPVVDSPGGADRGLHVEPLGVAERAQAARPVMAASVVRDDVVSGGGQRLRHRHDLGMVLRSRESVDQNDRSATAARGRMVVGGERHPVVRREQQVVHDGDAVLVRRP
jgi:hypothetical protein